MKFIALKISVVAFKGMFVSLWLTIGAAIFGFVFANLLAVSRLNTSIFGILSAAFVRLQKHASDSSAIFIAFGLPLLLGYQWPFWSHALLALSLNFPAYFAEILRAGLKTFIKVKLRQPNHLVFLKCLFC